MSTPIAGLDALAANARTLAAGLEEMAAAGEDCGAQQAQDAAAAAETLHYALEELACMLAAPQLLASTAGGDIAILQKLIPIWERLEGKGLIKSNGEITRLGRAVVRLSLELEAAS